MEFKTGAVLTVSTGRFLCENGFEDLYKLLNHMTGESLYTHQLVRASEVAKVYLWREFPELINVTVPDEFENEDEIWAWLNAQKETLGETFDVSPLPEGAYLSQDPIVELIAMVR